MTIPYRDASAALAHAYGGVGDLAAALTPDDLLAPSRCRGWLVADVLVHLLDDARRALVALHTPAPGPADTDHVDYWRSFPPGPAGDDVWPTRRSAAAFPDGGTIAAFWLETAPAAVHAAAGSDPAGLVRTQGHVLTVPDFLATLVLEAVVHHLDMTVHLPSAPPPHPDAVALAARSLSGLLGEDGPPSERFLLEGAGRLPSPDPRLPLLG